MGVEGADSSKLNWNWRRVTSRVSVVQTFFDPNVIQRNLAAFLDKNRDSRGTRGAAVPSFDQFARNPSRFIKVILNGIEQGDYIPQPAKAVDIVADKKRTVYLYPWPDRFIQSHLAAVLLEHSQWPDSLYSFRKGRSNLLALKRLADFIEQNTPVYLWKGDITSYGDSMNHQVVLEEFQKRYSDDERLVRLVRLFCEYRYLRDGVVHTREEAGLPTGIHLQLAFENIYLLELHEYLDPLPDSVFVRFGDDFIFLAASPETLEQGKELARKVIENKQVLLKDEKTQEAVLVKPHQIPVMGDGYSAVSEFEHLGMVMDYSGCIRLPAEKLARVRQLLRNRLALCLGETRPGTQERLQLLIQNIRQIFASDTLILDNPVRAYFSMTAEKTQLKEFDRWLAMLVLDLYLEKGFKKGMFRKMSFEQLRKQGLPSIRWLRTREGV